MDDPFIRGIAIAVVVATVVGAGRLLFNLMADRVPKVESSVQRAHERINELKDERKGQR